MGCKICSLLLKIIDELREESDSKSDSMMEEAWQSLHVKGSHW